MEWAAVERSFRTYLLSAGKSVGTTTTYCYNVAFFARWCAQRESSPVDCSREFVRAWIEERLGEVTSSRVHNDLAALKQFYRWLIEDHYRDDDPTQNLRVKRRKSLPTEPLERCDIEALLEACTQERDRLIVLMLAYTGLRVSELASLTADSVDWRHGTITVVGKGDKERQIAPNAEIFGRLHAFMGMFPSGPLFMSQWHRPLSAHQMRKLLYEIGDRARIKVHPHRFRAWFAVENIEQGVPLDAVQEMLGHQDISTTSVYTQATKKRRALEAMRRFDLKGIA